MDEISGTTFDRLSESPVVISDPERLSGLLTSGFPGLHRVSFPFTVRVSESHLTRV